MEIWVWCNTLEGIKMWQDVTAEKCGVFTDVAKNTFVNLKY